MRSIVSRTMSGMCTYVVGRDLAGDAGEPGRDQRLAGDARRGVVGEIASRTASEIASATLSGWPSVTDSDVNSRLDRASACDQHGTRRFSPAYASRATRTQERSVAECGDEALRSSAPPWRPSAAASASPLRCAAATEMLRTIRFTSGTERGATLSCRTPESDERERHERLRRHLAADGADRGRAVGGEAIVRLIRRSTAGCSGVNRDARFALPRSTASVYCTRSLVPMLKNDDVVDEACRRRPPRPASRSSRRAARRARNSAPRAVELGRAASSSSVRAWRTSSTRDDQRQHDADVAVHRGAQQRAQLPLEQLRLVEAHPDRAPAEERIRLRSGYPPTGSLSPPTSNVRMTPACPPNASTTRA